MNILSKFQLPSSSGLGLAVFGRSGGKGSLNQSVRPLRLTSSTNLPLAAYFTQAATIGKVLVFHKIQIPEEEKNTNLPPASYFTRARFTFYET